MEPSHRTGGCLRVGQITAQKPRRHTMNSTSDKIKGLANEAAGKVKQDIGKIVGNPKLEAEGVVQKHVGAAQQAVGEAKSAIKKVIDNA